MWPKSGLHPIFLSSWDSLEWTPLKKCLHFEPTISQVFISQPSFFSDTNCWSKYEANQKPHGREIWSPRRKYEHYPGRMAQRVSVLRQPSHMANLAQNQNQSCKTIATAGEDVRIAGVKMTILYHWELSRPDGAEGARQEFHRGKIDFAPILPFQTHLSSSHTTPLVDLHSHIHFLHLCAFDYAGPSV